MSDLGFILGGALSGIGSGLAAQAQATAASQTAEARNRHEIALENLRAQNQQASQTVAADLQDRNAGRSDQRGDFYDERKTNRTTRSQVAVDNNRSRNTLAQVETEQQGRERLARLNGAIGMASDAQKARLEADIASGQVFDIQQGDDGRMYGITRSGARRDLGFRGAPPASAGASSLLLAPPAAAARPAAAAPAPARSPAAAPAAAAPAASPWIFDPQTGQFRDSQGRTR